MNMGLHVQAPQGIATLVFILKIYNAESLQGSAT